MNPVQNITTQPQAGFESPSMTKETMATDKDIVALQSAKLLYQQQMLEKVEQELEQKRRDHGDRMKKCQEKGQVLEEKKRQYEERRLKFDKFLKENEAKKLKASAKTISERKQIEAKRQEVDDVSVQISSFQKRLDETQTLTKQWTKYRDFLIQYVKYHDRLQGVGLGDSSTVFESSHSISGESGEEANNSQKSSNADSADDDTFQKYLVKAHDIMARFDTLKDTNEQLRATFAGQTKEMDNLRQQISETRKNSQQQIGKLTSEQAHLQSDYEKNIATVAGLKSKLDECSTRGVQKVRDMGELLLAIDNLYGKSCITFRVLNVNKAPLIGINNAQTQGQGQASKPQTAAERIATAASHSKRGEEDQKQQSSIYKVTQRNDRMSLDDKVKQIGKFIEDMVQISSKAKKLIRKEKAEQKKQQKLNQSKKNLKGDKNGNPNEAVGFSGLTRSQSMASITDLDNSQSQNNRSGLGTAASDTVSSMTNSLQSSMMFGTTNESDFTSTMIQSSVAA